MVLQLSETGQELNDRTLGSGDVACWAQLNGYAQVNDLLHLLLVQIQAMAKAVGLEVNQFLRVRLLSMLRTAQRYLEAVVSSSLELHLELLIKVTDETITSIFNTYHFLSHLLMLLTGIIGRPLILQSHQ